MQAIGKITFAHSESTGRIKVTFMNAEKQRKHILLSNEALAVVERRKTAGTVGEWISKAIVDYDSIVNGVPSADADSCGVLEGINSRLRNLELMVAELIKRGKP